MSEFKLISPTNLTGSIRRIDWKLCLLCQKEKKEALKVPMSKPAFDPDKNSLRTLSMTLKDFEKINELPKHLKTLCSEFCDSTSLYDELLQNNASIHKSCSSEYNKQKYLRKKRKFDQISDGTDDGNENRDVAGEEASSSTVSMNTRRSVDIKTYSATCYFCEGSEDKGHLHECETLSLSEKVRFIAIELGESKLLAKLSQGDMVATEAKYHKDCLTKFCNRYRSTLKKSKEDSGNDFIEDLGEEICRGIPFWFCLTGCDTVSMFAHRGKITAWKVWDVFPEVTKAFVSLPFADTLSEEDFQLVQRFVVLLYDRSSSCGDVNSCRRVLFTTKSRDMELIPPTEDALKQHVLRAMLQSYIWCCADLKTIPERDAADWGWKREDKGFVPRWMTLPEAAKSCSELIKCGCKTHCQKRCGCKRAGMVCTELCHCGGDC